MAKLSAVGIYCGGNPGKNPSFVHAAGTLGRLLAEAGLTTVYGAGSAGMMGAIAREAMKAGGHVHAVTTKEIHRANMENQGVAEKDLLKLDDLLLVDNMPQRKQALLDASDALVVLPGGFGTLDELFATVVLKYLKFIDKPIVFLNVDGFWDFYRDIEDKLIGAGFATDRYRSLVTFVSSPEEVVPALRKELGIEG